jgi:hypothetical protein
MPVERKVIGTDPNGQPIYAGDSGPYIAPTPPATPQVGAAAPTGGRPSLRDRVLGPNPGAASGGTGGGGGGSGNPFSGVPIVGGLVDSAMGFAKTPNNYDAAGELAKSEAMVAPVYNEALGQGRNIARSGAPTSSITSQQIAAPSAITAQTIGTPDILGGDKASYLRSLSLDQAAAAANSPSAAAAQMRAAGGQIASQQLGQAAMARGSDRASAKRDAMLATGTQGMQAANSTAALAATEQAAKQAAYTGALAGIRSGDVGAAQAQTQIGTQNMAGDLEAQKATAGNNLTAAQANQGADLAASSATATNTLQGWTAQQAAQNAANATALQAVGAQNQAAGVAGSYGSSLNEAQLKNKDMMGGLVGSGLTALGLSDEDAKRDVKPLDAVSRYKSVLDDGLSLTARDLDPATPGQDFLDWQPGQRQAKPEKETGMMKLGSALGTGLAALGLSDEDAKRDVDRMDAADLVEFAHRVPMATFRYKEGVGEDDGQDVHAGTLAGALQDAGPLGRLTVHEGPDGLKRVDYGALDLGVAKGALAQASIAEQKADAALALARSRRRETR